MAERRSEARRVCSHTLVSVLRERFDCFACQEGESEKATGETRGSGARLLSNFLQPLFKAVKSNNQGEIMQLRFVNYKRVRRSTKGSDRCHLSPAASAVWLYHQRGNIPFWCLHNRSISISQDVIPFTSPSHTGLTPPKKNPTIFFLKANKTKKKKKKGAEKHPRWSSVHF